MDIRIGAEPAPALARTERREHARDDHQAREVSPGVIVELGRPVESAGTYSARGLMEGTSPPPKTGVAPPPGAPVTSDRVHVAASPVPTGPTTGPETILVPSNAQVHTLASASPQMAVALRAGLPTEAAHLHPPPHALTAGIQTLATGALQQTEKGNAAQEHDEETDPLRKEKDKPVRNGGKSRGR